MEKIKKRHGPFEMALGIEIPHFKHSETKSAYEKLCKKLSELNILKPVLSPLVLRYVNLTDIYQDASKHVQENGSTIFMKSQSCEVISPQMKVVKETHQLLIGIEKELCITPKSKTEAETGKGNSILKKLMDA